MLPEIPAKYSVSSIMGYLKGKSSLSIYERWGNAKLRYGNREFWCKGYYVDTTGKNTQKIAEYIRNQLKEDAKASQLTMDFDPITGASNTRPVRPPRALQAFVGTLRVTPVNEELRVRRGGCFF